MANPSRAFTPTRSEGGPQNLCSLVFICDSLAGGYGSARLGNLSESARGEAADLAVFYGNNQGGQVRPGVDQRKAALYAKQAHGGVQAVGSGGVGRNNGGLNTIGEAEAGRWIDDVGIVDAIDSK